MKSIYMRKVEEGWILYRGSPDMVLYPIGWLKTGKYFKMPENWKFITMPEDRMPVKELLKELK